MIPFVIAFRPPFAETPENNTVDYLIDLSFFIDLLLNFRTTYVDGRESEEIFDEKKIALHYFKSFRFWMDLFSTIPFDKIFSSLVSEDGQQFLSALGMLKLIRIGRISILIMNISATRSTKVCLKLLQMCFFFLLYVHIAGCILWFIVSFGT